MAAASNPIDPGAAGDTMIRIFLVVVAIGLVLLGGAVVYLGAFPPNPPQHSVEKVLPNDKFQTH